MKNVPETKAVENEDANTVMLSKFWLPVLERNLHHRRPSAILPVLERNLEVNRYLRELGKRWSWPPTSVNARQEHPATTVMDDVEVSDESAQNFGNGIAGQVFEPNPDNHSPESSKIIRARFNLRVVSTEQEQEAQAKELKDLAERAMTLDENATLQIGGITIIHKDVQGRLTMSTVREADVPIISSVTKFKERELRIEGCFLNGCGFKASTSSQYTDLIVFEEVKRKDGLDVIFAGVPEANELLLDDHTLIYAYKSVLCGAKSVIVRSEGDLIKTQQPSIIDEQQKSYIKAVVLVLFVIFLVLGIGWVSPLSPSSSFIVILGLAMLLPGTCWYLSGQRSNTSRGALDGEPTTASSSGAKVEEEAIYGGSTYSPIVAHKDIHKRGSVRKRVLEELRSVK